MSSGNDSDSEVQEIKIADVQPELEEKQKK
jgi:hypothetical protein